MKSGRLDIAAQTGGVEMGQLVDLYEAAAPLESLVQDHPFIDGNKRTAFAVVDVFLRISGHAPEGGSITGTAVANAIQFAAGKRIRSTPFMRHDPGKT